MISEKNIVLALKQVYDPEIPVNVYLAANVPVSVKWMWMWSGIQIIRNVYAAEHV